MVTYHRQRRTACVSTSTYPLTTTYLTTVYRLTRLPTRLPPTIASPLESFVIPSPTNYTATARKAQQLPTIPSARGEHRHRFQDATNIESNARRKSRSRKPRIRKPGSPWLHRKTKDAAGSLARTTASQRTGSARPPCCAGGCCRNYCTKSF